MYNKRYKLKQYLPLWTIELMCYKVTRYRRIASKFITLVHKL